MKPEIRALLTDLKAAALIGVRDSVFSVLHQMRGIGEETLPTADLLPLALALSPLPAADLRSLAQDADPAIRALAAGALGAQFALGGKITLSDLTIPARDPSPEVRLTLVGGLTHRAGAPPVDFLPLVEAWLSPASVRTLHTGLLLLPRAAPPAEKLPALLAPLHATPDHDLRAALVASLTALAGQGYAAALLDLLENWAAQPAPNTWLLTRALSANWTFDHSARARAILQKLADNAGALRAVRRALERHDAADERGL
jgi:hypothetical protein